MTRVVLDEAVSFEGRILFDELYGPRECVVCRTQNSRLLHIISLHDTTFSRKLSSDGSLFEKNPNDQTLIFRKKLGGGPTILFF